MSKISSTTRRAQMQRATEPSAHTRHTTARVTLNISPILTLKEAQKNAKTKRTWGGDDPFAVYSQKENDHRWSNTIRPDTTGSKRCA